MTLPVQLQKLNEDLAECFRDLAHNIRDRVARLHDLQPIAKRDDGDTTHSFDAEAEARIVGTLEQSGLNIRVFSEESGEIVLGSGGDYIAIVDPIDGSDLVARGYPLASIAACILDATSRLPVLSQIYEIFTSVHFVAFDGVAKRNGRPMKPSSIVSLKNAFIVTYSATRSRRSSAASQKIFSSDAKLLLNYGGPLDVAKVGSGQCDGMVETVKGFPPRDLVAGHHIARCAGAVSCSLDGKPLVIDVENGSRTKFLIAGNEALLEEMLSAMT